MRLDVELIYGVSCAYLLVLVVTKWSPLLSPAKAELVEGMLTSSWRYLCIMPWKRTKEVETPLMFLSTCTSRWDTPQDPTKKRNLATAA